VFTTLALGAVLLKTADISLVRHDEFATLEAQLRSSEQLVPARRGDILDAHGRVLATDRPSFDVAIIPGLLQITESTYGDFRFLKDWARSVPEERVAEVLEDHKRRLTGEKTVIAIAELSGFEPDEIASRLVDNLRLAARRNNPYARLNLITDLPFPVWEKMKVHLQGTASSITGVECVVGRRRDYPYGEICGHIVGYVSEMTAAQVEAAHEKGVILSVSSSEKTRLLELLLSAEPGELREVRKLAGGLPGDFPSIDDFVTALASSEEEPEVISGELEKVISNIRSNDVLRRLSVGEKKWLDNHPYLVDGRVGVTGVEASYNRLLAGVHGYRLIERTLWEGAGKSSEFRKYVESEEPVRGGDLELTVDVELQRMTEQAISRYYRPAAAVLMKTDGSILALASNPTYDPQYFATGNLSMVTRYLESPAKPMLSRAFQEQYPLGSVMKIIDAIAGLSSGAITPPVNFTCDGGLLFEDHEYKCNGVHGDVNLQKALAQSCNVYFFNAALQIGSNSLLEMGTRFGLGRSTGIDLPGEASGIFPEMDPDGTYKVSQKDLLFLAIGQGPMAVTPLQAARAMAVFANRGKLPKPHVAAHKQPEYIDLNLPADAMDRVIEGMTAVVLVPAGTGYEAFHTGYNNEPAFSNEFPYIIVAGKTGTAEHGIKRAGMILSHSWFAGYAPVRAPEVVVTVIIEGAGHGGGAAARVAAEILRDYFRYTRKGAVQ